MSRGKKHPFGAKRQTQGVLPKIKALQTISEALAEQLKEHLLFNAEAVEFALIKAEQVNNRTVMNQIIVLTPKEGRWDLRIGGANDLQTVPYLLMFNHREGADLLSPIPKGEKEIIIRTAQVQGRVYSEFVADELNSAVVDWNDDVLQGRMSLTYDLIFEAVKNLELPIQTTLSLKTS
jgi:hypothetical protein